MTEPIETVIVRIQQKFEIENKLNPFEIEINNDRVLNILKSIKMFTMNQHLLVYYFLHL